MIIKDYEVPEELFQNYMKTIINQFYKILPLKEENVPTLNTYIESFQGELLSCKKLVLKLENDSMYFRLLLVLQFLLENDCELEVVKREVFKAINLCKKLTVKYEKR